MTTPAEMGAEAVRQAFTLMPGQEIQRSSTAAPDDLCVWCGIAVGDDVCFNGKDICIDCCIEAGDPCGHAILEDVQPSS